MNGCLNSESEKRSDEIEWAEKINTIMEIKICAHTLHFIAMDSQLLKIISMPIRPCEATVSLSTHMCVYVLLMFALSHSPPVRTMMAIAIRINFLWILNI
jgi:hypothetical protein